MTMQHPNLQWTRITCLLTLPISLAVAQFGCATGASFVPDTSARSGLATESNPTNADDVFVRKPWEIWRGSQGIGRYHREISMVFTDLVESFKVGEISVYAADGSDVRLDYVAIDLGESSQSREAISAFVYRAKRNLEQEWDAVVRRTTRDKPGATETIPLPLPDNYPSTTKAMAWVAPEQGIPKAFFQVVLFHQAGWAVRLEITCPADDVAVARRTTFTFLRSIRVGS